MRNSGTQKELSLKSFFLFIIALSIPFWMFGGNPLPLPIHLPIGALVTFTPFIAAALVTYRRDGFNGVKVLLKRALDYQKISNKAWLLPALFLQPLIYFLSYVIMRLNGLPLPDSIQIPLLLAPILFVMFFIADAGEELGWTGFAIGPMQNRWGFLKASFLLGLIWATWHAIPYFQTHNPPDWIIWQTLTAIPIRILIVWIYNNSGKSVFASILMHVMTNISWSLFPNYGSYYNPFITGLITFLTLCIIAFVSIWKRVRQYHHA